MGDNRNLSKDSRSIEIGQIDTREVLGKAIFLFVPGDPDGNGPEQRQLDRIGVVS
jgi:signal peptidase I